MPEVWIQFKNKSTPSRLSSLSHVEEMMLENGVPHTYVPPPGDNRQGAGLNDSQDQDQDIQDSLRDMDNVGWDFREEAYDAQDLALDDEISSGPMGNNNSSPGSSETEKLEGWGIVADSEVDEMRELSQQISEAEDVVVCRTDSEADSGSDDDVGQKAVDRVKRYQAMFGHEEQSDPFWLDSFMRIINGMGKTSPNHFKGVSILSGCSGMVAEGHVCQAGTVMDCFGGSAIINQSPRTN